MLNCEELFPVLLVPVLWNPWSTDKKAESDEATMLERPSEKTSQVRCPRSPVVSHQSPLSFKVSHKIHELASLRQWIFCITHPAPSVHDLLAKLHLLLGPVQMLAQLGYPQMMTRTTGRGEH